MREEEIETIEASETNESNENFLSGDFQTVKPNSEDPEGEIDFSVEGTELESFDSAEVEESEKLESHQIISIVESLLFSTDRPLSISQIKQAFKGTNVKSPQIGQALDHLAIEYANVQRGVSLEEISGGFQLRTKLDNIEYLRRMVKVKLFKLSGPALEVMAIVAYKQPLTKSEIDEIRGVESGHLLRGLMEKGLVHFAGKSELPGKPMLYASTKKFLEIFSLRNIRELPSLAEIDELIPEGIGEIEEEKEKRERLGDLTGDLSREAGLTYSEGENELLNISSELETISTSTDFFEQEKKRAKEKRDQERAQDIRDALTVGEGVEEKDLKWLEKYQKSLEEIGNEVDKAFSENFSLDSIS